MDIGKINKINKIGIKEDIFYAQRNKNQMKAPFESSEYKEDINNDIATISKEAKALFREEKGLILGDEKIIEFKEVLRALKASSDHKNLPLSILTKCIQIAARIVKGDIIPNKDMQFLAENEPKLYSSAILLRQQNDKPKRYDSLLEDEETDIKVKNNLDKSISSDGIGDIET